ncbi:tRNA (adenosine(37)-N6)-dimethylallyltransferase MiaA [Candidatus Parcubacteria bacterium]|nr:tRNA (adenosine(37)-N6)-dimethylallyltransferase MiaA [Candidatus Parcubacteria bacterium]
MKILKENKEQAKKKLLVILGPTATGKTKLAVDLAYKFNGEIISADSRQVYKYLNIGTGKDLDEYKKIKYHLINIIRPDQNFTVAEYKKIALEKIDKIIKKNKIPFLIGGTGLYISSIIDNYKIPKVKPNKKIRSKLNKLNKLEKIKLLKKLDLKAFEFSDLNNPRRLERALEVCLSGQKFSESRKKGKQLFDVLQIGLKLPREKINKNIDSRVDYMIKSGLVNETKKILKKYPPSLKLRWTSKNPVALQTIGYAEIIDFLNKKTIPLSRTVELIKIHTHQFAKRQMTWFQRDKNINWIKNKTEAEKLIRQFLN